MVGTSSLYDTSHSLSDVADETAPDVSPHSMLLDCFSTVDTPVRKASGNMSHTSPPFIHRRRPLSWREHHAFRRAMAPIPIQRSTSPAKALIRPYAA